MRQLLLGQPAQLDVTDEHLPGRRLVQPGQTVQQRRLAGPRRTHDRGEPALPELRAQVDQRVDLGLAAAVPLGHADSPDGSFAHAHATNRIGPGFLITQSRCPVMGPRSGLRSEATGATREERESRPRTRRAERGKVTSRPRRSGRLRTTRRRPLRRTAAGAAAGCLPRTGTGTCGRTSRRAGRGSVASHRSRGRG